MWMFRSKPKSVPATSEADRRASRFDNPANAVCSFCGKSRRDTGIMVEGPKPDLYICHACADLVQTLFKTTEERQTQDGPGGE